MNSTLRWPILIVALFFFLNGASCYTAGSIIASLNSFKSFVGGYSSTPSGSPSLEATSHALFLRALYGQRHLLNKTQALSFIRNLQNTDEGYGQSQGTSSDMEATHQAVLSYKYLQVDIPDALKIERFIKSLVVDSEQFLLSNRPSEKGDIKSTALAFQTLQIIGRVQPFLQELGVRLNTYLRQHEKLEEDSSYFSFPETELNPIAANYFGVLLGSITGYFDETSPDLGQNLQLSKWANSILNLQSKDERFLGAFYSSFQKTDVSIESAYYIVSTLSILDELSQKSQNPQNPRFISRVNSSGFRKYVTQNHNFTDLKSAFEAHYTLASTPAFWENFDTTISFQNIKGDERTVIQGTSLVPTLQIKTLEGLACSEYQVLLTAYHKGSILKKINLMWDRKTEKYQSRESIDTSERLGTLTLDFSVRHHVIGLPTELATAFSIQKEFGYGITVQSKAKFDITGKEIAVGDVVMLGTDFEFIVTLHNKTQHNLLNGDFAVSFTVLDSSLVHIYKQTLDCSRNGAPIKFSYSLKSHNLPAGQISFRFEVEDQTKHVHSTYVVSYELDVSMIATQITFENKPSTYKIGDKVRVSIVPASFPDLRTPRPYQTSSRVFVLDVSSPSGIHLRSIRGTPSATLEDKYTFEFPILNTFESIGTNIISFRYLTYNNESIPLANYDSALSELYEDNSVLNFTVAAQLEMVEAIDFPKTLDFHYGNDISFRFKVKDVLSNQYITTGIHDFTTVYLSLIHKTEGSFFFTSAHVPATRVDNQQFLIRWSINPNAIQGEGYLQIHAQDADSVHIPIHVRDETNTANLKPAEIQVEIGGDIDVDYLPFSYVSSTVDETVYLVEFSLSCQNKSLKDALLFCKVTTQVGTSLTLPVATTPTGNYSVSWALPNKLAKTGTYSLQFYREVDRLRAIETREARLKRFLKKQSDDSKEAVDNSDIKPLFELLFDHKVPTFKSLPVKTETLVAFLLGASLFAISWKKMKYNQKLF